MAYLTRYALTHGALLIFAVVLLEQAGLPLPSSPALLSVGSLANSGGMSFTLVWVAAFSARSGAEGFCYSVRRSRRSQSGLMSEGANSWSKRVWHIIGRNRAIALLPATYFLSSNLLSLLAGRRVTPPARFFAIGSVASFVWSGGYIALGYFFRKQVRWTSGHTLPPLALLFCVGGVWSVARLLIRKPGRSWRTSAQAHLRPGADSFALAVALIVFTCPWSFAQQTSRFMPDDSASTVGASVARGLPAGGNETPQSVESEEPGPASQKQERNGQDSRSATVVGTVTDIGDAPVSGATVSLEPTDSNYVRSIETNESGFFQIGEIPSGHPYRVTVDAHGFAKWESPVFVLEAGEFRILDVGKLQVEEVQTTITVTPEGSDEIAAEQVRVEEKQRGFLIVPNFYEVYTPNPEPLTAKLKFSLAFRVARDPFTFGGVTTLAGIDQAVESPRFVEGARGYGERFAANYANAFTDVMLDGAILPAVLHQDPRYFYQGTGTKKSRTLHVISSLFLAKGDNGRWQPNYSSIGGDLASSAISNLYYPKSSRGPRLVFQGFAIDTAVHLTIRLLDEFVFRPPKIAPDSAPWNSNPHL